MFPRRGDSELDREVKAEYWVDVWRGENQDVLVHGQLRAPWLEILDLEPLISLL